MAELCLSSTSRTHFSTLLISDFLLVCSFITSHPLYFSYLLFFSPYLLKLLSFLSPLFITTSLLLLALLTVSPCLISGSFSKESSESHVETKVTFLTTAYHAVLEKLKSKFDAHNEELLCLEDFEVFKIVFGSIPDDHDGQVEFFDAELAEDTFLEAASSALECIGDQDFDASSNEASSASKLESETLSESESPWVAMEEKKRLDLFLQELDEFDDIKATSSVEKEKIEPPFTDANKASENKEDEKSVAINGSEAAAGNKIRHCNSVEIGKGNGIEHKSKLQLKAHSHSVGASADYTNDDCNWKIQSSPSPLDHNYNLGSYGSMRKGKDWKRTLACKLFEERNNNGGDEEGEGMDLLWETYEAESAKNRGNGKNKNMKKKSSKKKKCEEEMMSCDGEDDEDEPNGQICCLQALKMSAGRVNLGMARPNLVKISKAIKGIGWLHNLSRHRSKKVHSGDRF